jgi:hypothetical protein
MAGGKPERAPSARPPSLRLVVVNDNPRPPVPVAPVAESPTQPPPAACSERRRIDPRFFDLAAVIFTISLAFLLAYVFDSLDRADKAILCFMAGGTTCN